MTLDERKSLVKSYLGKTVDIIIDRPIGYVHKKPNYTLTYPINYGYIPGVLGGDGEELDVYLLGVDKPVNEYRAKIIGIVYRKNDIEDKLIAAPENMIYNQAQIAEAIHFQEQYYDTCVEAVYQKSCGVIVYRTVNGKREYLCLLQNISGTYSMPKGHLEAFESEQDCAKRELFEETGIKTQLIDGFKTEINYTFNTNSGTKHKSLTLFLAEYNGELNIDKNEIISYKWHDAEKAKQILPKGNDKVIDGVEKFLAKTHNMKLWQDAFYKIADGSKTIELRLNDEKRQKIVVGDTIVFNCTKNNDTITARVKELHKFADFKELYNTLPLDICGYNSDELATAHYTDMNMYYTEEQIEKHGVLGIELCDVQAVCDVKKELLNEQIYTLLTPSVYNPTTEKLQKRAQKYFDCNSTNAYVFLQDGEYVGIMVFNIDDDTVTINDIAVKTDFRDKGIGGKMIRFILDKFSSNNIIAETDDDAVGFYKKFGFEISEIESEFDSKRYNCVFKM